MTLTDRAAERINALLAGPGTGAGVRIGVKIGGCAVM
jgi:Fe-S cluster assembly iron-binding protein IscA